MTYTIGPCIDDRAAWKAAHVGRIGSGDAPVIVLGRHFGRTPMDLYLRELGLAEEEEHDEATLELFRIGNVLEPVVAKLYAEELGVTPIYGGNVLLSDDGKTCATPDYFVTDPETGAQGIIECKTTGSVAAWLEIGTPRGYWIQLQHQLMVTGLSWGAVAVLGGSLGGLKFLWQRFERDDVFIDGELRPAIAEFFRRVEAREPPPPHPPEEYGKKLSRIFPQDDGDDVTLVGNEWLDADLNAEILDAEISERTERLDAIKDRIRIAIGKKMRAVLPSGVSWSWKTSTRHDEAREARVTKIRTLRRHER